MKVIIMAKYYFVIILSALVISCGGGGGGGGEPTKPEVKKTLAKINKFEVKGTSSKNSKGEVVINPAENGGKWSMDWDVDVTKSTAGSTGGNDALWVKIYLSEDAKLSATDPEIYQAICSGTKCIGNTKLTMQCSHNADATPVCAEDTLDSMFQSDHVKTFLDTIPKNAYIIMIAMGADAIVISDDLKDVASIAVIFE